VIDEGELDGEVHYLVKWSGLPYDNATWETSALVESLDSDKVEEFHTFRELKDGRRISYLAPGRRAPQSKWKKLSESQSPKFKDDYSLRSYQLEGLNWLMFCWYNKQNSILADEMG
jgi:SNF2 family DNA or RNA helicase